MLERRSALATALAYRSDVLSIAESSSFSLVQAAGDESAIAAIAGPLPSVVGRAVAHEGRELLRIGPRQFWIVGTAGDDIAARLEGACAVVPLSASRTRIVIEGAPARDVLMKGIAIDFHPQVFVPGSFALTGVHHMPLMVHCTGENRFALYAMRSFAMSVWDWLTDAALEFANH
jgi:methylglutamate dehydrogenase subunit D